MPGACLILDCDGVLVDSELITARAGSECFTAAGAPVSPDEILERFAGMTAKEITGTLFGERGLSVPPGTVEAWRSAVAVAFERELRPMPGVEAALAAIPMPKCVASSAHPDRIALALRITGLAHHFGDAVFSGVSVARGKPAPDLFLHAAQAMKVAPDHCIVVEDSVSGVTAAKAAGMAAIGFVGGSHCHEHHHSKLLDVGADRIARSMADLPQAVTFERTIRRI